MTQLHTIASLDYGDGRTCICRICECGKHHCPGLHVPFVGETTYRDEYVPKRSDKEDRPTKRNRDMAVPTKAEPGHFKTTNQAAAELLDGKNPRPAESYKPRAVAAEPLPFEGTTTNRADFPGYMPEYNRVTRKQEPLPKLKGTYNTTKGSMDDPVQQLADRGALPKPPQAFRGDAVGDRNPLPFDGVTTYTVEYPPKDVPVDKVLKKDREAPPVVPENRDFETVNSAAYKPHPLTMRHMCPAAFVPPRPASVDGHIKLSVYNIPSGDIMS